MSKLLDSVGLTKLVELIKGSLPSKATSTNLGLVKPDGTTTTVDSNGTLSATGGAIATTETAGTVIPDGTTITIDPETGVISAEGSGGSEYTGGVGVTIDANNEITATMPFGSQYLQLLGINSGATALLSFEQLKDGTYSYFGAAPSSLSSARSILNLHSVLKINEDGSTQYITSLYTNPTDWYTWNEARWIYVNRSPNGKSLIWAKNFGALANWLTRRGGVSVSGLNATNVYDAIAELTASIPSLPDTPETDGNYKLVNTVTTDSETEEQSSELSWEEDTGSGGGSSYTFTNGLTETDGTVSWDLNDRIRADSGNSSLLFNYKEGVNDETLQGYGSKYQLRQSHHVATGDYSAALGYQSTATGFGAFACGMPKEVQWDADNLWSQGTVASGSGSVAMGEACTASGYASVAMGGSNTATGNYSVALGYQNTATGFGAVALGFSCTSTGGLAFGRLG